MIQVFFLAALLSVTLANDRLVNAVDHKAKFSQIITEVLMLDSTMSVEIDAVQYLSSEKEKCWFSGRINNSRFTSFSCIVERQRDVEDWSSFTFFIDFKATWIYSVADGFVRGRVVENRLFGTLHYGVDDQYLRQSFMSQGENVGNDILISADGKTLERHSLLEHGINEPDLVFDSELGALKYSFVEPNGKKTCELVIDGGVMYCIETDTVQTFYVRASSDSAYRVRAGVKEDWRELPELDKQYFWQVLGSSQIGDTVAVYARDTVQVQPLCSNCFGKR